MITSGYKRTEVGVIPEEWELVALQDAAVFLDEQRRPVKQSDRAEMSGIYPYYGASGIVDYVNDYLFDEELILLGEDGENILSRNLPLAFKVSGKIWVNNHAHVLRVKNGFDIDFLTEYLESLDYQQYNSGTAQPKLNKQTCLQIPVVKPAEPEQRAIAAALSDVDNLIATLDKLIAKKQAVKTAVMQDLLTGRRRLPGFEGEWEVKRLGEIADIGTGSRNNQDKIDNGKYPFFVRSQTVERINSYSFDGEAILIPGEGGIGSIFHYIDGRFDFHQRVYKISDFESGTNGKYVYYSITKNFHKQATRNSVKATVDSLRLPTFQEFEINMPEIEEQTQIAAVLSEIDAEITALQTRRDKTTAIKQGMMQELLTGRVRLV